MRVKYIFISKRIITAVLGLVFLTSLYMISTSMMHQRWKQEIDSPGLAGKTVMIDPGHGGADPGAVVGKLIEADLNMDLALALKRELEEHGVTVKLTREGQEGLVPQETMTYIDRWMMLEKRKRFAIDEKSHFLISIHSNSNKDPRASGGMVFYADDGSRLLAVNIQEQLNALGMRKREAQKGNFTIINNTPMPSVLIETGFITNKRDLDFLISKRDLLAAAIYKGLDNYSRSLQPQNRPTEELHD